MRAFLPVIAYAAFIFWLSSLPPSGAATLPHLDKVLHLGEYGVMGVLLARAFMHMGLSRALPVLALTVVVGAVLAGLDEAWQGTVGREQSWLDWVADVAGLAAAGLLWPRLKRL